MPISTALSFISSPLRGLFFPDHPTPNPVCLSPSFSLSFPQKTTLLSLSRTQTPQRPLFTAFSTNSEFNHKFFSSGGSSSGGDRGNRGGGGGDGDDYDGNEGNDDKNKRKNKEEAFMALGEAGRSLEGLPKDLKAAIEDGRIPGSILVRYLDLEKSGFLSWLVRYGGFKQSLPAQDLFFAKVAMKCGAGIFTEVLRFCNDINTAVAVGVYSFFSILFCGFAYLCLAFLI